MNSLRIALLPLLVLPFMSSATFGQPLCLPQKSLEWLMIDSPVVIRARLTGLKPIRNHPKLSELHLEVLESFRGGVKGRLEVPVETMREGYWAGRLIGTKKDVLLFLVKKPRGYQKPLVRKVINHYRPSLYYFLHVDLEKPLNAITLEMEWLHDRTKILKKVRELAREKLQQPRPASFTFQLPNSDTLTVPLNRRMELVATKWRMSQDSMKRHYGAVVTWGFKRHRNKPFESGYWYARIKSPGGDLRFGLRLDVDDANKQYAMVINGSEVITVRDVTLKENSIRIEFPHYDSVISASLDRKALTMKGTWRKRVGKMKWTQLPFLASMKSDRADTDYRELVHFYGKWQVKFSRSKDPAVAEFDSANKGDFRHRDVRQYRGTVLTTTGDYRFLAGDVVAGKLELSVFDGAHAFLFRAERVADGRLKGDFWSGDTWHETWTATRDTRAKLPDAFKQTGWRGRTRLQELRFPNLRGRKMSLADQAFSGKVRIITLFGSWCPNCHDSAAYLSTLHRKYSDKGLSILGLAFELTGDFQRDAQQVRRYMKRHRIQYPILLAGLADKVKASQTLPILDRVRSYPTTIFLSSRNEVISIHTGFTGPATGKAYQDLKSKFEAIIEHELKK